MFHSTHKKIGVIGLGIIGRGVSENLRRKGFRVFVWNRTPRPVPNFVASPAELAEICDHLQIFVSDDEALLQTIQQLSEKITRRHIVLAHSTVAPDSMRAAAQIVERSGARFVEAPFTGSKVAAAKGELVYYVAGTETALQKARPILEASSKEIIKIGEIGQATAIKIATNMITAANVQAAAEALAIVHASGLPLEKFVEAMQSNASHSTTLGMKLPKMIQRDFDAHFSTKHMLKDMQIANQLALSHDFELAVTAAARDRLLKQMHRGHANDDYSAVAREYLPETVSADSEKTETAGEQAQVSGDVTAPPLETTDASAKTEEAKLEQENRSGIAGETTAPVSLGEEVEIHSRRAGFLKQLWRRAHGLRRRSEPVSSKQE